MWLAVSPSLVGDIHMKVFLPRGKGRVPDPICRYGYSYTSGFPEPVPVARRNNIIDDDGGRGGPQPHLDAPHTPSSVM